MRIISQDRNYDLPYENVYIFRIVNGIKAVPLGVDRNNNINIGDYEKIQDSMIAMAHIQVLYAINAPVCVMLTKERAADLQNEYRMTGNGETYIEFLSKVFAKSSNGASDDGKA